MSFPLTELVTETERKPSLVDDAYAALKDAIRQGVLPSGYQGSEQEIAGKLNMSRTPVHEAIIRLQSEGLVKVLSKRGVFICTISPDDMREIYDVIIACESMAAELLASLPEFERGTKANALETLNVSMGFALQNDDLLAWAKADDEFIDCSWPAAAMAASHGSLKQLWINRIGPECSPSSCGPPRRSPWRSISLSLMPLERAYRCRRTITPALTGRMPVICFCHCSIASV
jgi:DNA-binding GntR family transcriptional regulator